ncbi:MAG: hypothetical protein JWR67_2676, partial [Mucilaginibacter sp.]|nr:hypothetical protein [Mucilaginibacter sp.]
PFENHDPSIYITSINANNTNIIITGVLVANAAISFFLSFLKIAGIKNF